MKRETKILSGAVLIMFLFAAGFIVSPVIAQPRSAVAVQDAKYDVSSSIKDNLKTYVGKDVLIHLRSGKTFQGYVKAAGDHFVHVEKLSGRDYYDALIRIDDISAIEARFRDMK
ncbi:MAG: hypothetical protein WCO53_08780 [Deltaproteobacteria bacterium]|jgi:small nuclear ribonucleoprotein (snRNP)-like protein